MNIINCFFTVVIAAAVSSAAGNGLSGKVVNRDGSVIAGATVKLLPGGKKIVTGTDGRFTFSSTDVTYHLQTSGAPSQTIINPVIAGNVLRVDCRQKATVEIVAYTTRGQVVASVTKEIEAGGSLLPLPYRGAGVYLYRIKINNDVFIFRSTATSDIVGVSAPNNRNANVSLMTQSKIASSGPDEYTILVAKEGYVDYSVKVSATEKQELTLRPVESAGTVTDIEGNVYQTVRIGTQVWTVENFRSTRYNDGELIPEVPETDRWGHFNIYSAPEPNNGDPVAQCCYYNNTNNLDTILKFGMLYNWYAVKTGKLAPEGWRVPDTADWLIMRDYLLQNPFNVQATSETELVVKALAAGTNWINSTAAGSIGNDFTANNLSGFGAVPAGYRTGSSMILFMFAGEKGYWWTSTEKYPNCPCWFTLYDFTGACDYLAINDAQFGLSVRLIKNN